MPTLRLGLLLALTASALPSRAAEPPPHVKSVEVLGPRELTLPRPVRSEGTCELTIAIRCTPPEAFAGLDLQTISVALKGQPLSRETVRFRRGDGAEPPAVVMVVDLGKAAEAGTYTVKAQPGPSDPAQPLPPLEFTLTRPAAELQAAAPLRVERVVYLPWVWDRVDPTELRITEKANKSDLVPAIKCWTCDLRRADGTPAGRLPLQLERIEAGGQGCLTIKNADLSGLGRATGTYTVRSPQLAGDSFETTVEVTSRVTAFWLLLTVVAGIFLGYLVRTSLEARRLRALALIPANELLQSLNEGIESAADPKLRQDLEDVRKELRTEMGRVRATPETIDAAVKKATDKRDQLLKQAEQLRAELRKRVETTRVDLGPADNQPEPIRGIVQAASQSLGAAAAALDSGHLQSVKQDLDDLDGRLRAELPPAAGRWATDVAEALSSLEDWPETRLAEAKKSAEDDLAALGRVNPDDPKALLAGTRKLWIDLAGGAIRGAMGTAFAQAKEVLRGLRGLEEHPPPDRVLGALGQAGEGLEANLRQPWPDALGPAAESLHALRAALGRALTAAVPEPEGGGEPTPPASLAQGRFVQAFREILAARPGGDQLLGREEERRAAAVEHREEAEPLPAPPPAGTWSVSLEARSDPVVRQPLWFRARLTAPEGSEVPKVTVRWFLGGRLVKEDGSAPLDLLSIPARPGALAVRAEATAADGSVRFAEQRLTVREPEGAEALPVLEADLKRYEGLQTAVSGVLIALIGLVLYRGTWVGTLEDFLVAFLWGFSVDVGVAKVRELGAPLVARLSGGAKPAAG
ncbi:MAG TPA: hypothetical protein VFW33_24250 [Gemmataceae bacterium]|nr:hypothetical protein [Gemmataceae bacterium]